VGLNCLTPSPSPVEPGEGALLLGIAASWRLRLGPPRCTPRTGRPWERVLESGVTDRCKNSREIVPKVIVRETKHTKSGCGEKLCPLGAALPLASVDVTIDFNSKPSLNTAEIKHERTDRMLPPELQPIQPATAQRVPQQVLSPRFARAQISRGSDVVPVCAFVHDESVARRSTSARNDVMAPGKNNDFRRKHSPLPARRERGWG
jgi:hypothetical protein